MKFNSLWVVKIQPYMALTHYYLRNPNHDFEHIYLCFASLPQRNHMYFMPNRNSLNAPPPHPPRPLAKTIRNNGI